MDSLISLFDSAYDYIKPIITADNIALFSVLVTILIFILNRHAELKYKKHEDSKQQYMKLIQLLSITYTEPEKLTLREDGTIAPDIQKQFFDTGASLMLYASKKLYKQYIFFRDFSTSEHIKLSKYYDENLIIYIIADILKQIRKEVGMTYWNSITSNQAIAFFVNDLGNNPTQTITSYERAYRIKMLKLELFFMNRFSLVTTHKIYYNLLKPIFGFLGICFIYLIALPIVHLAGKIFSSAKCNSKKCK